MRRTKEKKELLHAQMANLYNIRIGMVVVRTTFGTMRTVQKCLAMEYGTMFHAFATNHTYARKKKVNAMVLFKWSLSPLFFTVITGKDIR